MSPASEADPAPLLSHSLRELAGQAQESVSLGDIASAVGGRAHALALLVLVLPETIPLPIPSISTVLGIPLVLVAGHLVIHGDGTALPVRMQNLQVPTATVRAADRWVGPVIAWLETLSRPHWQWLADGTRFAGLLCLYLSVILLLPIPLVNLFPALCLAAVALGLIRRDGIYVAIGMVGTIVLTIALVSATNLLIGLFVR